MTDPHSAPDRTPRRLSPRATVAREFLLALWELLLGIPRQFASFALRKKRLARFHTLRDDPLPQAAPPAQRRGRKLRVVLSCGDASGEAHAIRLLRELRARYDEVEVRGFGGAELEKQGMQVWEPLADLNVMGFQDVLAQLPLFFGCVRRFTEELSQDPPDLVLLIDYPGLNRHLLRIARRAQVPVVDYIAPQLWAWAPWRVRDFRRADRLLTILPFESDWYERHGAAAQYIGHPLGDGLEQAMQQEAELPAALRDAPDDTVWVGLLPGSRRREIVQNLPQLLVAALDLQTRRPEVRFVLPHLRPDVDELIRNHLVASPVEVIYAPGCFHRVLPRCRTAAVASGTALLEVAAHRVPPVLIYRVASRLGAWLARHWLTVPFIGGLNLLARRELAPEHVGREIDLIALVDDLEARLDGPVREQTLQAMETLRPAFAEPGAAARTAEILTQIVE